MNIAEEYPHLVTVAGSGCWLWTGGANEYGYGRVKIRGRVWTAHRLSFLMSEGYLPPRPSYHHRGDGKALVLDHLCDDPRCVNPDHLEVVTQEENIRRQTRKTTHCPHGHPYSGENLIITNRGWRACRECKREKDRRRRARL